MGLCFQSQPRLEACFTTVTIRRLLRCLVDALIFLHADAVLNAGANAESGARPLTLE